MDSVKKLYFLTIKLYYILVIFNIKNINQLIIQIILIQLEYFRKHVAQWIEHQIPILKAGGSIPFMLIVFFELNSKNTVFLYELV